ncbi:sensor histidine kinase [Fulvivirga sedimenti]|uniref:Histidine kinase n=1 Tax=Fulvivirga sedimenti TaxID=2879465 RepID=A0A9X1HY02_9BACT|nr:histidine kinase [Fulvivirga sedimenti]MCA6078524.1 histidine kinase [Fulvivirga sedimenti]
MQVLTHIKREKLYWLSQIFGWGGFFIIQTAVAAYFVSFSWQVIAGYANVTLVGFILTHIYRGYIKRKQWLNLSLTNLAVRISLASVLIAMLWAVIVLPINSYYFPVEEDKPLTLGIVLVITMNLSIVVLSWSMIYFIFQLFVNYKQSEVEKWQLEAAVKDAELIALKSQVNPHFIFNSLNNIRSLVIENPEKARDMITHLSGLLRYSIQFNNKERVSLEDELEIVQNYLNLESIQFEDRLQYKLEIKPETLEMMIPPMAIQLLVENAIKHGISNLPEGGLINIKSSLNKDHLIVEVINTGQLKEGIQGTGIGLRNASDRLKLLFGKLSDLTIKNMDDRFVSASFSIPLNK